MKQYKKEAEEKLLEIANIMKEYDFGKMSDIGLLGGYSGVMIFLFHCSRHYEDQSYADKAVEILYKTVDIINQGDVPYNYSGGISGFGWTLEYLAELEFIDTVDILHELDVDLSNYMTHMAESENWDALHGGIGIAWYLILRKENPVVLEALEKLVDIMEELSIEDKEGIKWVSHNNYLKISNYNFGLAHGMPSIIIFLKKCIENNINKDKAKALLDHNLKYILSNKIDNPKDENIYPLTITDKEGPAGGNRLAWCYGDPGIVLSLIQANEVVGTLDKEIISLTDHIVSRKGLDTNRMSDACVCHGTVGMIPMLQILKNTSALSNIVKDDHIDYWLKETLDMMHYKDGIAGYKMQTVVDDIPVMQIEIGLLEGVVGVGLSLLTYINGDASWGKTLMMN